jgi:hypothetical protein
MDILYTSVGGGGQNAPKAYTFLLYVPVRLPVQVVRSMLLSE